MCYYKEKYKGENQIKKLKNTKRDKITLMCILLIIAGIVITSICFSKRTMATATKPNCYACGHNGNMEYLAEQSNSDVHAYKCSIHPMVIETANHTGGKHSEGKCSVCSYVYQNHTMEESGYRTLGQGGSHTVTYKCTVEGCSYTSEGQTEGCTGATHENGGKCEKCKVVYQNHTMETSGYVSTGTGGHSRQLTCTYPNCGKTALAETTACTGGKINHDGKCTVCGGVYVTHNVEATGYRTLGQGGSHTVTYKCTVEGCGYTSEGQTEACTGGLIHASGGKCDKCKGIYEQHTNGAMYNIQYIGHREHRYSRECINPNCMYNGFIENCDGGFHKNGGRCKICKATYQNHETTVTFEQIKDGQSIIPTPFHKIISVCQEEECDEKITYMGTEPCYGYSHDNGGVCRGCGKQIEKHSPTSEIVDYDKEQMYHTAMYKCSVANCQKLHKGISDEHDPYIYVNKWNGCHEAQCKICGYFIIEEHEYSDTTASTYSVRLASNNPIRLANNTEKECVDCGALASEADNGCEHSYVEKNDENQHWEECTNCGYLKVGSLKGHEFTTYTDNEDGKHSSSCDSCGYKVIKEHYYVDGVCDDCGVALQECEHEYVLESDKTNHWMKCSKCDDIRSESTEEHQFEIYVKKDEKTHIAICKICTYGLEEEHDENCDKCTEITNPDDDENKPGNENNDNNNQDEDKDNNQNNNGDKDDNKDEGKNENIDDDKKDNTIIDTILPNTGVSRFVIIAIIMIGILVIITKVKLKKYKGI